jgi:hypothetical protein
MRGIPQVVRVHSNFIGRHELLSSGIPRSGTLVSAPFAPHFSPFESCMSYRIHPRGQSSHRASSRTYYRDFHPCSSRPLSLRAIVSPHLSRPNFPNSSPIRVSSLPGSCSPPSIHPLRATHLAPAPHPPPPPCGGGGKLGGGGLAPPYALGGCGSGPSP